MTLRLATAALLLGLSGLLAAQQQQGPTEVQRLQASLSVINAEIKANLDEIAALQEAVKGNSRAVEGIARGPGLVMFDDVQAAQRQAVDNEAAAGARVSAILARNAQLDAQKPPLVARIQELLQAPR